MKTAMHPVQRIMKQETASQKAVPHTATAI